MKFVLINGPKRSGKTTFANLIKAKHFDVEVIGFSYHLKRFVHGVYLGKNGFKMDPDSFDAIKDVPQELLDGMSWRQAYIHYSENVIKPLHGPRWFGAQLIRSAREMDAYAIAVPDSGFVDEGLHVVDVVHPENVLLVRMHKYGCVYDHTDSRGYIHLADHGVHELDILNNGTVEDLRGLVPLITDWLMS